MSSPVADPVLTKKAMIVERCVARAREEYAATDHFKTDYSRQDAAVLNIQRACDAAIDMALRIIRNRQLGAPMANAEAFDVLVTSGLLPKEQGDAMKKMVGFRNVVVHQYQELDLDILESVILRSLDDVLAFSETALRLP